MLQCPCTCTARIRLEELTTPDTINKSMLRFVFVPPPRFYKKGPREPVDRLEMATWVKGGYGMDYSGGRAPGYYPSVWPVECGGPRRQKLHPSSRYTADRLTSSSIAAGAAAVAAVAAVAELTCFTMENSLGVGGSTTSIFIIRQWNGWGCVSACVCERIREARGFFVAHDLL